MANRSSTLVRRALGSCRARSPINLLAAHASHLSTPGVGLSKDCDAASLGGRVVKPRQVVIPQGSRVVGGRSKPFSTAADENVEEVETSVQGYYDDPNALNFHLQAWGGGGDIHIGRYDLLDRDELEQGVKDRMKRALVISKGILLRKVFPDGGPVDPGTTVADMGAAFGGTSRTVAKEYGANVVCIELSRGFNAANADFTAAEGLSDKITIPGERSFFDTKLPAASMDAVISQDSFLHSSTEHHRAIEEASRVLKPGGVLAFTDILQTDHADTTKLAEVYGQIGITRLASPGSYEAMGNACGLELVEFNEAGSNVGVHYEHLVEVCLSLRKSITGVDDAWFNRMVTRYGSWVTAMEFDVLTWGLLVFRKKSE